MDTISRRVNRAKGENLPVSNRPQKVTEIRCAKHTRTENLPVNYF